MSFTYLVRVYINSMVSVSGETVVALLNARDQLKLDNTELELKIAEKSSLKYAQEEATQMGFVKIKKVEYIK